MDWQRGSSISYMYAFFLISNMFGLLITGLVLWFLITRRQRFIEACVR
jgi:hypothetical protein